MTEKLANSWKVNFFIFTFTMVKPAFVTTAKLCQMVAMTANT